MRELQERAKISGGESKEMRWQQLNSVSGVRGWVKGRKEKLIEAVIETVTEVVTVAALEKVSGVEHLAVEHV